MKRVGGIAVRVAGRLKGSKRPGLDRSFAGRFARRIARNQRRHWRENGLRPRGRGYDWARTLVAEELLKRAAAAELVETTIGELAAAVRCTDRIVRLEIARLCAIDGFGAPADAQDACVVKLPRASGPGKGVRLAINRIELARRVLGRLKRNRVRSQGRGPQLALPLNEATMIPAEIQAAVDRIQELARTRFASSSKSEHEAKAPALGMRLVPRSIPDPFPHTPQTQKYTPSDAAARRDFRSASRPGTEIPRRVPVRITPPGRAELKRDWLEIAEIDKSELEPLSERHRRRLMRHLRFACWSRGLDLVRTRHVTGAIGWEAQRLRKATSRKYLIIDGVNWVLTANQAELRGATAHFLGMVKVVRGLSAGSDPAPRRSQGQ